MPLLGNDELARIFYEIGDMLEIRGDDAFKVGAYRRGAESIATSPLDIAQAYRDGRPPKLPGVGKAIDEKLDELADTGRLRYYERLRQDVPPSVVRCSRFPDSGRVPRATCGARRVSAHWMSSKRRRPPGSYVTCVA